MNSAGQRRRVGSRAAARTPEKMGWPDSASSSFSLPADGKKPHHLQQKQTHKQSILSFYFFVFGSDFCSFFSDLLLPLLLQIVFPVLATTAGGFDSVLASWLAGGEGDRLLLWWAPFVGRSVGAVEAGSARRRSWPGLRRRRGCDVAAGLSVHSG